MAIKKRRTNSKAQRNQKIYAEYIEMIKSDPEVQYSTKSKYYTKLADKWFLDEDTISKIINKAMKYECTYA